jgi:hypothetical protein
MAGILANSATKTMVGGDTAADQSVTGYISAETVTLSTSPAPSGGTYSWGLARPSGSTAKAALSDDSGPSVTFTPDVAGLYVVTVSVNSATDYVLTMSVTQVAQTTSYEAIRLSPKPDAAVPAPTVGVALYYSSTQDALAVKKPDNSVHTVDLAAVV